MKQQEYNLREEIIDASAKVEKARLQLQYLDEDLKLRNPSPDPYEDMGARVNAILITKAKHDFQIAEMELSLLKARLQYFLQQTKK